MAEISLNILDIAENSTKAGASLVVIQVIYETDKGTLTVYVKDDGCGMSEEALAKVTDPFFTSRKTRDVGLGVPFFKLAAELTGGNLSIESELGKGTTVKAVFLTGSINCMPLGDIDSTIYTLITCHPDTDFIYEYIYDERSFTLDTREMRVILGDIPLNAPEVSRFIMDYLKENREEAEPK